MKERQLKPGELYEQLWNQREEYNIAERGEGMCIVQKSWSRVYYLMNTHTQEAWQLRGEDNTLTRWTFDDVDYRSIDGEEHTDNAHRMFAPYYFGVNEFIDGRAVVSWMLHPEGRYHSDSDGFGGTDDDEVNVYAVIDNRCNLLHPFSLITTEQADRLAYGDKKQKFVPKPVPKPLPDRLTEEEDDEMRPSIQTRPVTTEPAKPGLWERLKDALLEILMA